MTKIQDLFSQFNETHKGELLSFPVNSPNYPIGVVDGWTISSRGLALKEGESGNVDIRHVATLWRCDAEPVSIEEFLGCYDQHSQCLNLGSKLVFINIDPDVGGFGFMEIDTKTFEYEDFTIAGNDFEITGYKKGLEDMVSKINNSDPKPDILDIVYVGDSTLQVTVKLIDEQDPMVLEIKCIVTDRQYHLETEGKRILYPASASTRFTDDELIPANSWEGGLFLERFDYLRICES